jgi:hypothetical protein
VVDSSGAMGPIPTESYWWRFGVPVHVDHTYRATAVYDNPTGKPIPDGAMGAMGGVFLPDDMRRWPAVDRSSPEYQKDVQVTYDTGMGDMDDMHDMQRTPVAPTTAAAASAPHEGMREGMVSGSIPIRRPAQTP